MMANYLTTKIAVVIIYTVTRLMSYSNTEVLLYSIIAILGGIAHTLYRIEKR